jgi:starch-binding outer membrane protein, SusD/RagB family
MTMTTHTRSAARPSVRTLAAGFAAVLLTTGCGLLDTQQPNIIDPGTLNSPAAAQSLRNGALADFAFVKDGDGSQFIDGLILVAGLLSDEFIHSTTPPSEQEIDQRTTATINPSLSDVYRNLHKARAGAELAAEALLQFPADTTAGSETPDVAEMQSIAGFTYLYFGEDFCSGVPFSKVRGDTLTFGQPETTPEIFATALAKFDSALAQPGLANDDGTITNLATVGRARALLDLDRFAEAADAASAVPTEFVYNTEHSASPLKLQNAIWSYTNSGLWSVSDLEGDTGLPYRSANDPRVPYTDTEDVGLDLITPQFNLDKYPDATAPVPVADGIEARLIEAEAQLQADDLSGMRATLNDLRQNAISPALSNLPTPANHDAAVDQLFSERGFWLYATGHRLGDMRRLIRVYGRDSETVFPTGAYHKNGTYGPDVNLPIPIEELNNSNSHGCIDRNA